ncbi:O-antigen ligase family protein [Patescibacteria group bacterium]|nr:O-antigen ligase family protein [Patescibacteria group bacterium]
MQLALLLILFILFALLAWHNLKMALILLSGLLPAYLLRLSFGPIPSTALEIMILICVVVWMIKLIWPNAHIPYFDAPLPHLGTPFSHLDTPPSHPDTPFSHPDDRRDLLAWIYPTVLLLIASIIGIIVAPDTLSAIGIWKAYFIEPILVAVMMLSTFNKKDWTLCLQALSFTAITLSLFAIFQYLTGVGIPIPWDIELRATSVFDYPNALGLFLAPIVTFNIIKLALSPFQRGRGLAVPKLQSSEGRRGSSWISILTIILGLIAIILSQTEAALVAIPVAVIITLLISKISKKKKLVLLILSVLLVLFSLLVPTVREKLLLQDYSGQVRLSQWSETLELAKDHPFFGAGLNGYPTALGPYHNSTLYEIFQYPHNIFLNIWSELGILGLIALFWFAYLIIKRLVSPPFKGGVGGGRYYSAQLTIFSALLTIFIHGLVDVPYFKNDLSILTWILLAGLVAIQLNKKPKTN